MSAPRWTPKRQGDLGEASALEWLASQGAAIYVPVFSSPDVDLVAVVGEKNEVVRVQVKTSTAFRLNRWDLSICTRGGNQSWNGIIKRLDATRCDVLFAHVGDGRRWWIPMPAVDGGTTIRLGGPKYAPYEIEPGRPLPSRPKAEIAADR